MNFGFKQIFTGSLVLALIAGGGLLSRSSSSEMDIAFEEEIQFYENVSTVNFSFKIPEFPDVIFFEEEMVKLDNLESTVENLSEAILDVRVIEYMPVRLKKDIIVEFNHKILAAKNVMKKMLRDKIRHEYRLKAEKKQVLAEIRKINQDEQIIQLLNDELVIIQLRENLLDRLKTAQKSETEIDSKKCAKSHRHFLEETEEHSDQKSNPSESLKRYKRASSWI